MLRETGLLRVTAGDNDGLRALAGDIADDLGHLTDTGRIGTSRKEVSRQKSRIVNTLNGNLAGELPLQVVRNAGTNDSTLCLVSPINTVPSVCPEALRRSEKTGRLQ